MPLKKGSGSKTMSKNIKKLRFQHNKQTEIKAKGAKTKQRNEIKGSTRKIVPQKGSGGARHASRKAPIFVGGGIAHGPKGDNYKVKKINNYHSYCCHHILMFPE